MIVENIIPRNMFINLGCASVDNHIPRDDIFDYHPRKECNIYIILLFSFYYDNQIWYVVDYVIRYSNGGLNYGLFFFINDN